MSKLCLSLDVDEGLYQPYLLRYPQPLCKSGRRKPLLAAPDRHFSAGPAPLIHASLI